MKNDVEVSFYHFTCVPLLKAVPSLIAKIYDSQRNSLVLCKDEESLDELNKYLWSFSTKIFLPHGSVQEKHSEKQPILLSTEIVENNKPRVLLSFIDIDNDYLSKFESVMFVFFGNKKDKNVEDMYNRFNNLKNKDNLKVKFWLQDVSTGKWQQAS